MRKCIVDCPLSTAKPLHYVAFSSAGRTFVINMTNILEEVFVKVFDQGSTDILLTSTMKCDHFCISVLKTKGAVEISGS